MALISNARFARGRADLSNPTRLRQTRGTPRRPLPHIPLLSHLFVATESRPLATRPFPGIISVAESQNSRLIQGPNTTSRPPRGHCPRKPFATSCSDHRYVTPPQLGLTGSIPSPYTGSIYFQECRISTHPFSGIISVAESQNQSTKRDVETESRPPHGYSPSPRKSFTTSHTGRSRNLQGPSMLHPFSGFISVAESQNQSIKHHIQTSCRRASSQRLFTPSWDADPSLLCHGGTHCHRSLSSQAAHAVSRRSSARHSIPGCSWDADPSIF